MISHLLTIFFIVCCVSLYQINNDFNTDRYPNNLTTTMNYGENHNKFMENTSYGRRRLAKSQKLKRKRLRNFNYTLLSHDIRQNLSIEMHPDKLFLFRAMQFVNFSRDLVFFNGHRTKQLFDVNNVKPHLLINRKLGVSNWIQLSEKVRNFYENVTTPAVHIHNEEKIGDILLLILEIYKRKLKIKLPRPEVPINLDEKIFNEIIQLFPRKLVITNTVDENWGFLSSVIGTRTTKWINMTNHLRLHYSDYHTLRMFLDSDKILLMTANTHIDEQIGFHEKIISIPLGIKGREEIFRTSQLLLTLPYRKKKLLAINNSGWGDRTKINEMVIKTFNNTIQNTYKKKGFEKLLSMNLPEDLLMNITKLRIQPHLAEIALSKFVLCPSGLGMDTYRLWETLMLGSIPIVESNKGFDRTYSMLPVLIVPNFDVVTPDLLNEAYPCFAQYVHHFNYEIVLEQYWINLVETAVNNGNIDHVQRNHPPVNPFCNFF